MRQLRALGRMEEYAHLSRIKRYIMRSIMTFSWPIGALIDTIFHFTHLERPQNLFISLARVGHMYALALTENVMPIQYIVYRLYEPNRRAWAKDYLYWSENNILRILNDRNGADNNDVQDKGHFAVICKRYDLPYIPTLAIYQNGRQTTPDERFIPDKDCIWVKDITGSQRSGANQWRLRENLYHDNQGKTQTPEELAKSWLLRDCLVQPVLSNHPQLNCLSDGSLVDFRIITGIESNGQVHVITHLMTLPWGGFANRSFSILCKLDEEGRVICAFTPKREPVERHPETHALIAEVTIPFWPETLGLVKRAHQQAFSRFVFLGWDVAITPDGPVLIETNSGPDFFHHQLIDDVPLGHTLFPKIVSQYIEIKG
ncbi:MAG: sugar-transfer associated ATP-grasp domain-containing protein [Methylobacter sp.]|uniref:sugar-transfer associated ATP-grasp domain-containing protein n=1 Tax=Methylobacter sp. TaxID=2051955 RepID=UPI00273172D9|nr:sugar-transfer associated ATP-grasp domain-containing protein [Methylobacter sp.]MDP1663591.1 sugar-transfer associated ATP-grasp domain-containing protein [Methylobacter sp.]